MSVGKREIAVYVIFFLSVGKREIVVYVILFLFVGKREIVVYVFTIHIQYLCTVEANRQYVYEA